MRIVDRQRSYLELGHPTMLAYMEAALGYAPRTAQDRLRIAYALEELPVISAKLERGELPLSAVKELTRVATATTEAVWIADAEGKNVRDIERLVAGHKKGDKPTDRPDPDLAMRTLRPEVSPATEALWREARKALELEIGHRLTENEYVALLCRGALEGSAKRDAGRASHQIALTLCEHCSRATQDGGGMTVDVPPSAVERARCDAQHLGRVDGVSPIRAKQDIPPAVRRQVCRRDHDRCTVPGCRSGRYLEVHHIIAREDGGTHVPSNLTLLCGAHHQLLHEQRVLTITGEAPSRLTFTIAEGWRTIPGDELEALLDLDRWKGAHVGAVGGRLAS